MSNKASLREIAKLICSENSFVFVGKVGEGAFKEVFHVVSQDQEELALKVIQTSTSTDRTEREIEAILKCDHPNIAKLRRIDKFMFKNQTFDYFIEDYLDSGNLAERLNQGCLSWSDTIDIGINLINAISHIASLDLVHRDIKPANIMFKSDFSNPILVDFGIVRDLTASSITQTWRPRGPGTPYYSAPEQLNNEKDYIDWRTDQFSLGVLLCFARYKKHPYQHDHEPLYDPDTVVRVASRGRRSPDMLDRFQQDNLGCLIEMTSKWSVRRFRRPNDLMSAWLKQRS